MMFATALGFGLMVGTFLANATADFPRVDYSTYEVQIPTIEGTANGVPFSINGSLDQVFDELQKIHPGVDLYAPGVVVGNNHTEQAASPFPIVKSSKRDREGRFCTPVPGQPWQSAYGPEAQTAINRLRDIGGTVGLNPRQCARMYCQGRSSIWTCNDLTSVTYIEFRFLADMGQEVHDRCSRYPVGAPYYFTGGQLFESLGFNTIVKDGCHHP